MVVRNPAARTTAAVPLYYRFGLAVREDGCVGVSEPSAAKTAVQTVIRYCTVMNTCTKYETASICPTAVVPILLNVQRCTGIVQRP